MTIAIILAAGYGRRFKDLEIPKCLLELNGKTIIEYSLDAISEAGIKKTVIVVGFMKEKIIEKIGDNYNSMEINYVENRDYENSDTSHSLYLTKKLIEELNDSVLTIEGDLIYDKDIIKKILAREIGDPEERWDENILVISDVVNHDSEVLVSSSNMKVKNIGSKEELDKINIGQVDGEYIGICKLSKNFFMDSLTHFEENYLHKNMRVYCEKLFLEFSNRNMREFKIFSVHGIIWGDVDSEEDLDRVKEEIIPKLKK
jgi:choline kinase